MANNYLDKTGVIRLINNVKNMFASVSHTHKKSDIDDLIIDSEFSSTSTNPIQNKVVSTGFGYVSNAITSLNSDVANKSDKGHGHAISDVTDLQDKLDETVPITRKINEKNLDNDITLTASDVGADPAGSANTALSEAKKYADELLSGSADASHNHNDLYYTKEEIDNMELVTTDDIDLICGTVIQVATASEVTF